MLFSGAEPSSASQPLFPKSCTTLWKSLSGDPSPCTIWPFSKGKCALEGLASPQPLQTPIERTHFRYYVFLACSLFPSFSFLLFLPTLAILIHSRLWIFSLQSTRTINGCFSNPVNQKEPSPKTPTSHRFLAFWLRSSVRLSQLHPNEQVQAFAQGMPCPSTSAPACLPHLGGETHS